MGVYGNRDDRETGRKGLIDLNYNDFYNLRAWTKLSVSKLKEAVVTATDETARWAKVNAAKDVARLLNIPYKVTRERVKIKLKRRMITGESGAATARIWYGMNNLSLKYLNPKQLEGGVKTNGAGIIMRGFISKGLDGHVFKRTSDKRLPIQKQELSIEQKVWDYLVNDFEPKLQEYWLERFYSTLDSMAGNMQGSTAAFASQGNRIMPTLYFNPEGRWLR